MQHKASGKIFSALLALVMLLSLLPATAMARTITPVEAGGGLSAKFVSTNPVHYYGRSALSALTNSTALLYAYDQLAAGVENSAETITVYNGANAITQAELEMVMDAYRRDYAHHFWMGNSYQVFSNAASVVSIKPTYIITGTDLETAKTIFEQKVTDILSGITSSMSEYEKELYLHDKLAGIITYYAEGTHTHNAYGALVEGKAVCEGYAEAFQYLLQRVGIQSFLAIGASIDPGSGTPVGHEWNYVRIDDKYYHVDLTWNDQGENLFHAYFNQTDEVMQEDHTTSKTGYVLPVCNSATAQYFTGKDEYLDNYTADTVGQLLKDNDLKVHVYIPGTVNDFISWYQTNIGNIGTEAGITGGFSYGYTKLGRELILYVLTDEEDHFTVSGTVTSFNSATDTVTIELFAEGSATAAYTAAVKGNTAAYSIEGVAADTYTMKVSKNNHVTREYTVVIGTHNVAQDAKIHPKGDITGEGKITTIDFVRANSHARGASTLTGYELACADIVGTDGKVTTVDAVRINAHAKGTSLLW